MFTVNDLIETFDNNIHFAWELLHAEIMLETTSVNTQHLKSLIVLYSNALEIFNNRKLPQQHYFKFKINQLMGQKKVIHCLTTQQPKSLQKVIQVQQLPEIVEVAKLPSKSEEKQLQARKQDLQLRIAYGIQQSKNVKVKEMINAQLIRTEKLKDIMMSSMSIEEEKLNLKIARRQKRANRKIRQTVESTEFSFGLEPERDHCVGDFVLSDICCTSDTDNDI